MKRTKDRILAARKALDAAGKVRGQNLRDGHGPEEVIDLLADLMHCCHAYDVDFDKCLSLATDHFAEEKEGAA